MPRFETVDDAVRWFLSHAGCGDVRDIRMHTEHKWTEGQIAAALRRIGARKLHMPTGWEQVRPFRDGEYYGDERGGKWGGMRGVMCGQPRSHRKAAMFALPA